MTEVEEEEEVIEYLEWTEWSKLLKEFKCPRDGTTAIRRVKTVDGKEVSKIFCEKCNAYLEPPKREKVKEGHRTVREKESAAEGSGGSLYPPLPIYYFCEECQTTQLTRIEEKNKYEREADLPLTIPTGNEGFTWSWAQQIMMTVIESELLTAVDPDPHTYLPFTCPCGARYELALRLKKRDKIDHPRFAIMLGFHNKCNGCKHAFGKSVGTEHFKFRCDKNLQCQHMRMIRDKFPNKIWTVEE